MIDKIINVDKSSTGKIYIPIECSLVMDVSAYNIINSTIDADLEAADFSPDNRAIAKEVATPTIHQLTISEIKKLQEGNTPSQINPVNIVNTGTYFDGQQPSVYKITFGDGKQGEKGLYAAESMIYKYDSTDASNPLFTLWIDASDLEFSRYLRIYRETETTTTNEYIFTPEVYYHEEDGKPVFMTLESDASYEPVLYVEPGDYTPIFLQQIN